MKFNVHGTQLQADDGLGVFTTIAQLETVTLPEETRGSEDVPTHDQAVGEIADKIVDALFSIGEMAFTVVKDFADGTHDGTTGLDSYVSDTESRDFQLVLPDASGTTITVSGWIGRKGYGPMPANRGVLRGEYSIIATARPTIT